MVLVLVECLVDKYQLCKPAQNIDLINCTFRNSVGC